MMRNKEWEEMERSAAVAVEKLCRRRRGIRRRVREPGGTEHTSTRDDCNSGESSGGRV